MTAKKQSRLRQLLQRFGLPAPIVSLYYLLRFGARVSPRAEVEVSPNLRPGRGLTVSSFTKLKASHGPLVLGERCGIATGCFISAGEGGIHIGDNFICGPNVTITSSSYISDELDRHLEDQGQTSRGVRIGSNVWIGAGSVVLDGAELGDNTIVVAGSLVNRRYPPASVIHGSPAKVILRRQRPEPAPADQPQPNETESEPPCANASSPSSGRRSTSSTRSSCTTPSGT